MRWYVSRNGETVGPVEEAELADWARTGQLGGGAFIRDEAGGTWTPIEHSPFASLCVASTVAVATPLKTPRERYLFFGGIGFVFLGASFLLIVDGPKRSSDPAATAPKAPAAVARPAPPP